MKRALLKVAFALLVASILVVFASVVVAKPIPNSESSCVDFLIVFARGSSDNSDNLYLDSPFSSDFKNVEHIPGSFFQSMQYNLETNYPAVTYKAVSIHSQGNFSADGYPAAHAFGGPLLNIPMPKFMPIGDNAIQSEADWWPWGDFSSSVASGVQETTGYIRDQLARCPSQKLVLGGYSQGALVIGQSLFDLTPAERDKVAAVSLFGDPQFNPGDTTLADYVRGQPDIKRGGIMKSRSPYLPADIANRSLSWCFWDDLVCQNMTVAVQTVYDDIGCYVMPVCPVYNVGEGHSRYRDFGAPQAASEIMQRLSPQLRQIEQARGGLVDKTAGPSQAVPPTADHQPIDMMLMVNSVYGYDDVLGQLRFNSPAVLNGFTPFYNDVRYGHGDYGEYTNDPDNRIPRVEITQQPTSNIGQFQDSAFSRLAYGGNASGGYDGAEPHQTAIERGVMSTQWRSNAYRHLVLITSQPQLDSLTYNICSSSVRAAMGITSDNHCLDSPALETDLAVNHSERCQDIWQVLNNRQCAAAKTSDYAAMVTRTVDDAMTLARAKGVAVDVIEPHLPFDNLDAQLIAEQLKHLAEATGGLYVAYSDFSRANFSDAMWQILNHTPRYFNLQLATPLGLLTPLEPLAVMAGQPIVLDVSDSPMGDSGNGSTYGWDFDSDGQADAITNTPTVTHIFDGSSTRLTLATLVDDSLVQATWPITVVASETNALPKPQLPPISWQVNADGGVQLFWPVIADSGNLLISDANGNVLQTVPVSTGYAQLATDTTAIGLQLIGEAGMSDKQTITIRTEQASLKPDQALSLAVAYPASGSEYQLQLTGSHLIPTSLSLQRAVGLAQASLASGDLIASTHFSRVPSATALVTSDRVRTIPLLVYVVILTLIGPAVIYALVRKR